MINYNSSFPKEIDIINNKNKAIVEKNTAKKTKGCKKT